MDLDFNFDSFESDFYLDFSEFEKHFDRMISQIFHDFEFQDVEEELDVEEVEEGRLTDAPVFFVNPSQLPHGKFWRALGVYVPYTHEIYIANNLPPRVRKFVYYHEVAHSLGIMDESQADRFATEKCGYYLNLGRPMGFILRY